MISIQEENIDQFKNKFLFAWLIANAIGLVMGWVLGEWSGLQVAKILGWRYGQIVGFVIFESLIWVYRWAVLYRIRAYDVLKPFDVFIWMVTELLVWFGMESSNQAASYREDSLFGIISTPILAYFLGVTGWLILWLINVQAQKAQHPRPVVRSIISSFMRVGGSLLIFAFYVLVIPISTGIGEAVAKSFGWVIGRAVAGFLLGGLLGTITGLALLKLMKKPTWDE